MSNKNDIQTAIREFVLKQFPAARKRGAGDDESLLEQGVVDSMGVLEIVTFIESEFNITLTDDELMADHFETVAAMADFVHRKTMEGASWTS